jgi:Trk K+ transport system NAD-binding subunit
MIVERNQKYIVPNGKLLLKKGDKLLLISAKNDETAESKQTHNMLEMISVKRSKQR